ncbi:hypothetical protein [Agilicoccus flavus]|uniref:hypothetical protein n=1 Tax=Agilicoccus flavus TaxID=2775968 RepID=UPI001CF66B10|nr:hypothetical protein [Agilicoccus flavus]
MSTTSSVLLYAPMAEEATRHLPMPAWAYGAIALGVVLALLGLVWMFRRTAQVAMDGHPRRPERHGDAHHGHADLHDEHGYAYADRKDDHGAARGTGH